MIAGVSPREWWESGEMSPGPERGRVASGLTVVNPVATRIARFHGFVWQLYSGPVVFASVDEDVEVGA